MSDSIIKTAKCCYFCGSERNTEKHHCVHGVANRKLADKHGLWVYLCASCHRGTYGVHGRYGHERDTVLKQTAQYAWMMEHYPELTKDPKVLDEAIAEWISIFGKSWI